MTIAKKGYQDHPCKGCFVNFEGCEEMCRMLEQWNVQHMADGEAA